MLFTTPWFLVFAIITFGTFSAMVKWTSGRRWLLLVASLIFYYHFAGLPSMLVVIILAITVYFAAIVGAANPKRHYILVVAVALPILTLIYFRYTGLISETLANLLPQSVVAFNVGQVAAVSADFVPLGISFFAFEFCHYLAEVMKGGPPVRNPLHFAIFSFFYPRMAAGPIIRYQNIIPQIELMPVPNREDVVFGLRRIIFGFIKKFLFADPVATLVASRYTIDGGILCGTDVIYLCLLLYIRIYMDFSAYSDMAIGLARLWGLRVPENFNFPFVASSPSTFWRRWHISLSTWIRDYVYIPLGGARGSPVRRALNVALAMALCGLWHGSAWHFVLWGVFHGVLLIVSHFVKQKIDGLLNCWLDFTRGIIKDSLKVTIRFSGSSHSASGASRYLASLLARLATQSPDVPVSINLTRSALGWLITQTCVAFSWLLFFYPMSDVVRIIRVLPISPIIPAIF